MNVTQNLQLIHTHKPRVAYKDLYLRLLACLIGSHIIVVYGETKSTFAILLTPAYYYAVLGSFIIAFSLFSVMRQICKWLDKKFDWVEHTVIRIGLQLFLGVILPSLLAFLMAALYFAIRGRNILQTSYLRYDFHFIVLQLVLINFYYVSYYFYVRWLQAERIIKTLGKQLSNDIAASVRETFQVSKGAKSLLLPIEDIAYCYREGENNYLRTVNGEDFFIELALDEVQQKLPQQDFFRVNRQMIAQRRTLKGYELLSYGKLKADLWPPYKEEVVVSQKRAVAFKNWMEQKDLAQVCQAG